MVTKSNCHSQHDGGRAFDLEKSAVVHDNIRYLVQKEKKNQWYEMNKIGYKARECGGRMPNGF